MAGIKVVGRAGHDDGWGFTAPVVDMPRYLDWLLGLVRDAGGRLELRSASRSPGAAQRRSSRSSPET